MFHKSNYGTFGSNLPCDMNGYVPERNDSPFRGAWDHGTERTHDDGGELTEYGQWWEDEGFPELLERVAESLERADESLTEWQSLERANESPTE
jgi:hypothetical protein